MGLTHITFNQPGKLQERGKVTSKTAGTADFDGTQYESSRI